MAQRMLGAAFALVLETGSAVNALFATTCTLRLLATLTLEVVLMIWWAMPRITRRPANRIDQTHRTS
jgi:hypothetical protein